MRLIILLRLSYFFFFLTEDRDDCKQNCRFTGVIYYRRHETEAICL